MSIKKLELKSPIISTYTSYGFLFSILPEENMTWAYNNLIQIRYAHNWGMYVFAKHASLLSNCPAFDFYLMPVEIVHDQFHDSFLELVTYAIDKGFYLMIYVDRYYIPGFYSYHKNHQTHELIISGYDLETRIFLASDNVASGKYKTFECDMHAAEEGYKNVSREYTFMTDVRLIRKKRDVVIDFDIRQVLDGLYGYMNAIPAYDLHYEQDFTYGLQVYDILLSQLELSKENHWEIDLRGYHFLYEHKLLMTMRLKYMEENHYIRSELGLSIQCKKLEREFLLMRNIVIKNNLLIGTGRERYLDIRKMILNLVLKERELISSVIGEIEWYMKH